MSEKSRSKTDVSDDVQISRDLVRRSTDAPDEVPERQSSGGVFGFVGRASSNARNFGREVGGSAQRLTRQVFTEAEHLVDVALSESEPSEVVHGEVLEVESRDDEPLGPTREQLRERGDRLLAQSAGARSENRPHPAFEHIVAQISPDEARILRLLHRDGPQPSVDVRTNRPFGVSGETVAAGLTMISEEAGCRDEDRVRAYLGNLYRLGLIWFSKEQVAMERYELLQVQPVVVDALAGAGRSAKTVRRRIEITPFGTEFCTTAFTDM